MEQEWNNDQQGKTEEIGRKNILLLRFRQITYETAQY
jgi:hypothetical protein